MTVPSLMPRTSVAARTTTVNTDDCAVGEARVRAVERRRGVDRAAACSSIPPEPLTDWKRSVPLLKTFSVAFGAVSGPSFVDRDGVGDVAVRRRPGRASRSTVTVMSASGVVVGRVFGLAVVGVVRIGDGAAGAEVRSMTVPSLMPSDRRVALQRRRVKTDAAAVGEARIACR